MKIIILIAGNLKYLQETDIWIHTTCDEQMRIQRLSKRHAADPLFLKEILSYKPISNNHIKYSHKIELDLTCPKT